MTVIPRFHEWLILSNSELERVALKQIANKTGAKRVAVGPLDVMTPNTVNNPMGAPLLVLAALGARDVREDRINHLSETFPDASVLLFPKENCELPSDAHLPANIRAVVRGDLDEGLIAQTISLVGAGYTVFPSATDGQVVRPSATMGAQAMTSVDLTPREYDVCRHIARGQPNKEIARALGITVNTVSVHVAAIRRKMGVSNRTQIALSMADLAGAD